jgi:hypothetical protein
MPINGRYAAPEMKRKEAVRNLRDMAEVTAAEEAEQNTAHAGWLPALRYAIRELTTFDDPTLANCGLLCGGLILGGVATICCIAGLAFIFRGDLDSSRAITPYFTRSAFFAAVSFTAVHITKGRKR